MKRLNIYLEGAPRAINGFLPPYLLNDLARLNPEKAAIYFDTLKFTASCFNQGQRILFPLGSGNADRLVYDAQNKTRLPGLKVRGESDAEVADPVVNNAFAFSGSVRGYLKKVHSRNSLDGNGGDLITTVHYGNKYNNAFWNGRQMTYGDGDGDIFSTFVLLDVNGHEMGHGVTENTSGLEYYGQSGALNEHMSDVFGELVEQWTLGQRAGDADWLVGKGLFMPKINGKALRSMLDPGTAYDDPKVGKDPQPGHMDDYVDTWADNGGVHYNSGIPNKAFALFAIDCGGYAWERAALIWFETLNKVNRKSKFQEFADMTVKVAGLNFPEVVRKLRNAWGKVGITAA